MASELPSPDSPDRDWGLYCFENPDAAICDQVESYYDYRLAIVPNALFLGLFGVSLIGYIAVYGLTRRGLAFTFAMCFGVLLEVLGYAGRVMSWQNQWNENGFLMQICCLTIGPAFLAAGIYLCLRRIVRVFGEENSVLPPKWYTRIFIPCDVVSLVLQATGGGMASVASHNGDSVETGDNIMIAGLAFQVFTLLAFILVSLHFAFRTWRRTKSHGAAALDQDPRLQRIRNSFLFKGFVFALALATICIFWRSVFRVAELSQGWEGPLMANQGMFIGFEGVLVVVACLVLNVFHPSLCVKELMESEGMACCGARRKTKPVAESETVSDVEAKPTP